MSKSPSSFVCPFEMQCRYGGTRVKIHVVCFWNTISLPTCSMEGTSFLFHCFEWWKFGNAHTSNIVWKRALKFSSCGKSSTKALINAGCVCGPLPVMFSWNKLFNDSSPFWCAGSPGMPLALLCQGERSGPNFKLSNLAASLHFSSKA